MTIVPRHPDYPHCDASGRLSFKMTLPALPGPPVEGTVLGAEQEDKRHYQGLRLNNNNQRVAAERLGAAGEEGGKGLLELPPTPRQTAM